MFKNPFKKSPEHHFLSKDESADLKELIRKAEENTSGEIRICIESKCRYIDPLERARELFYQLQMEETHERNAVLIYIAYKHREFALFSDIGFYDKIDGDFWSREISTLKEYFKRKEYKKGLEKCIMDVGNKLSLLFPYQRDNKNELPDEIVFGK